MDFDTFKRILVTFADRPADMVIQHGKVLVDIREMQIDATLAQKQDGVVVTEAGTEWPVDKWLTERIARLPTLADRILEFTHEEPSFVVPSGNLLDQLEFSTSDEDVHIEDTIAGCKQVLERRPFGTASILYLTSDAGEGKTTLINYFARRQAEAYKKRETDWLLVPIPLGGRAFLRFDEVVTATLANRFRFPRLYHESFVELVRLGKLVPAFDGYEEMFIVNAFDAAVSTLGNLIKSLRSAGSVLIAARKAYFDYKGLDARAQLYDTLGSDSIAFARLKLNRWDRERFVQYGQKRGVPNCASLYDAVSKQLGVDHPLLTRAVLVRRLFDVASKEDSRESFLEKLTKENKDFFGEFINAILLREVEDKWIDKSSDPARPLTTLAEHHQLLAAVAHEMWLNATETLSGEMLDFVAELFCESRGFDVQRTRQIVERLKTHALIPSNAGAKNLFCFDHEEFLQYFLGEAVGQLVLTQRVPDIRNSLRRAVLPAFTVERAGIRIRGAGQSTGSLISLFNEVCVAEGITSFARENSGALLVELLSGEECQDVVIERASFPRDGLAACNLRSLGFRDCYFSSTSLADSSFEKCAFTDCKFEQIEVERQGHANATTMRNCEIRAVVPPGGDQPLFDPGTIRAVLAGTGFQFPNDQQPPPAPAPHLDSDVELLTHLYRHVFNRTTQVNENTFRQRLGARGPDFMTRVLPQLLRAGLFKEVAYRGSGQQTRYGLNRRRQDIDEAFAGCEGHLERFLALISARADL